MANSDATNTITAADRGTTEFDKGTSQSRFLMASAAPLAAIPTGGAAVAPTTAPRPVWRFTILAGITTATANYYGGPKAASQMILDQIWTVNRLFNELNVFNGMFQFEITSMYQFDGPSGPELQKPHPGHDYLVIYDGYPPSGGGWHSEVQGIHHYWSVNDRGGTFGNDATDGLIHEFGHARGAIDIYQLRVEGWKNPVNGQDFKPVRSIMNEAYGVHVWDEYSINLMNKTANQVNPPLTYITEEFPAHIDVVVKGPGGLPMPNSDIRVHAVEWGSLSVTAGTVASGTTSALGVFTLPSNPFGPGIGTHYSIQYCNFLVSAAAQGKTGYAWMPLYDAQNWAFNHGRDSSYPLKILM